LWKGGFSPPSLARADRASVEVEDVADQGAESCTVAREVLDHVLSGEPAGVWKIATACEAAVALGDHDRALNWAATLVARPDADAFAIASLLRQLVELWELETDALPGQILLPLFARPCSPATAAQLSSTRARPAPKDPTTLRVSRAPTAGTSRPCWAASGSKA
jgi:hypothetical protein